MEDKSLPSTNAPPPAARTAESLRALQDRARTALSAQRERMGRLEAQLTEQLDSIASALAEQTGSQSDDVQQAEQSRAEAERLRQEHSAAEAAWQAKRDRAAAEQASRQQHLDRRQSELDGQAKQLDADRAEFDAQATQLDADRAEVDSRQQALDDRAAKLNAQEREVCARQKELADHEQRFAAGEQDAAGVTRQLEEQRTAWESERAALDEAKAALEQEREELIGKASELTDEVAKLRDASTQQLADVQQQLNDQQAAWDEARTALENERQAVVKERDELTEAMARSGEELAAARKQAESAGNLDELQHKFDLALEDVQRLRRRVAELEQELAARPAVDETDSVELVHLRSERDTLAERVAKLEQQPAQPADGDAAQEVADLQRRFELAVEDVRELKKTNSRLEAQLAEGRSSSASAVPAPAGEGSWEARKKQMLASLEGEIDDGDEERRAERATIENTIAITDDVVANKDREIAALKALLAEGVGRDAADEAALNELIDADAVIQKHRDKIAQLEREMHDKLRAAELELSVERAKIAREQAQLADLRADLDSMRPVGGAGNSDGCHAPKRRWLAKLGLAGDDEGK